MLSADPVPVKSTRSKGAMARVGCPDLWADWLGCVIRSYALSNLVSGNGSPRMRIPSCPLFWHQPRRVKLLAPHHHGPGNAGDLISQGDGGNHGRSPLQ